MDASTKKKLPEFIVTADFNMSVLTLKGVTDLIGGVPERVQWHVAIKCMFQGGCSVRRAEPEDD